MRRLAGFARVGPGLWLGGFLLAAAPAAGAPVQAPSPDGIHAADPSGAPKLVTARRVEGAEIRMDGHLDDEAWGAADFQSDFHQKGAERAFDPRVRTEVAFLYDDEALYVGARMQNEPGTRPRALLDQRDAAGSTERVLVSLDTYRDGTTAYTFGVTIGGVRVDYVSSRDMEGWMDPSFDPVWEARVARDSAHWTAELRVPFSQLRFNPGSDQVWGLNVRRWNPATSLNLYWVVIPFDESGWVSRFGRLDGIRDVSGGASVEVTPYVVGRATRLDASLGGGPDPEMNLRVGGDAKLGLGSNLTLDATLNPDFGQVEADPARVNLSAFETFFPERRPFFLEGQELFRGRGPTWFYSRRIGSLPAAVGRDRFEQVESATVHGGAKLTGRLPVGLSVGALWALTAEERVPPDPALPGGSRAVAPATSFGVASLRQEVGQGGSIGLIATDVERFMGAGGELANLLPARAWAGGLDWGLRFGAGGYEATGFLGGSRVAGTPSAMALLQFSSTHFFQRPDAEHLELDPLRTSLTGWTGGLGLAKIGGAHWLWSAQVSAASPGFDIRDAGAQGRADRIDARTSLSYGVRDSRGGVRNRRFGVGLAGRWNFGGDRLLLSPSTFATVTWSNLWTTTVSLGTTLPALSDDLTRGGPLMEAPRAWWGELDLTSETSTARWWSLGLTGFRDEAGGWSSSADGGLTFTAGRRVELSTFLGGSLGEDVRQFVTSVPGGGEETFGSRWVFSTFERRELFLRLRAKLAFAPDAVLTLYGEPFVSSGRALAFGELVRASGGELRRYGTDGTSIARLEDGARLVTDGDASFHLQNPDFHVRSLRGTAVFRWEWRGSTLFLIWQRSLWNVRDEWRALAPSGLIESLDDPGQDVAAVKVTVRLGG